MPEHDDRPEPEVTVTERAAPPVIEWREYKLKWLDVAVAVVAGLHVRVQALGNGFQAIEVEGLEPAITEESREVCKNLAERSAYAGYNVRRFVALDGGEVYR